jgi:UDP-GlcNAc:undecaprenyl-phosphate GlcNAc-1-phosphate transferase
MLSYTFQVMAPFVVVVAMILALDPFARRVGWVDRPGGRKAHDRPTPVTGGIAMYSALALSAILACAPTPSNLGLALGLTAMAMLGALDDVLDLSPHAKLAGQFAAALAIVGPAHHTLGLGALLGSAAPGVAVLDTLASAVLVVGLANAFNMFDGLDGLAGGTAAVVLADLAIVAACMGLTDATRHILTAFGAVLGFLPFNARHPWRAAAAVFMGDAGSLLLGATIASAMLGLANAAASAGPSPAGPSMPALAWLVALPCLDMASLIARRTWAGASPFRGDRQHLHHLLLRAGLSPAAATAVLVGVSAVLGGVGVAGWLRGLPPLVMAMLLLVPAGLHLLFVLGMGRLHTVVPGRRTAAEPLATSRTSLR